MMRLFNRTFLMVFGFYKKHGENDIPQYYAFLIVFLSQFFNVVTIFNLLRIKYHPNLENNHYYAFIGLVLFIINYFKYLYKNKYLELLEQRQYTEIGNIKLRSFKSLKAIEVIVYIILSIFFIHLFRLCDKNVKLLNR